MALVKAGGQLVKYLRLVDVEVIVILYTYAYTISNIFIRNLITVKATREWTDNSSDNASDNVNASTEQQYRGPTNINGTNGIEYWQISQLMAYNYLLATVPALLVTLVLAPLSDLYGRQLAIVVPLLGRLLTICCYTIESWSPESSSHAIVLSALPEGLSGSFVLLSAGLLARIRDVSGDDQRRFSGRVGRLLGLEIGSRLLGTVTGAALLDSGGQGAYVTGLLLTALTPPVAMLALSGEKSHLDAVKFSASTVFVAPVRAFRVLSGKKWLGWYMLATTIFYISQGGQYYAAGFFNGITGLRLNWNDWGINFSCLVQDVLSVIGLLLHYPIFMGDKKCSVSAENMAIVGNLAMTAMSVGIALDYSGSYFVAFGVSCFILLGCLSFVANIACISNTVTPKEIGSAMAAYSILIYLAMQLGPLLDVQLIISSIPFYGSGPLFSAALFVLVAIIYAIVQCHRNKTSGQTSGADQ